MDKTFEFYRLSDICAAEPLSIALGYFDGLHLGHAAVIKSAVLNNKKYKSAVFTFNNCGGLPKMKNTGHILSNELKISLIKKMGIDFIISLDFNEIKDYSPERFVKELLVKKLSVRAVCCGRDFRFGKNGAGDIETLSALCESENISVNIVDDVMIDGKPISSTFIRRLIAAGEITRANLLLGYDLMFESEVVKGAMIGRKLGTPTINQIIPDGNIIPKFGVYKSFTELCGVWYKSLTNIGVKPTVSDKKEPLAETYIIGYSGDLYGKIIRVSLSEYIREEIKFIDLNHLKSQIEKDILTITGEKPL